MRRERLLVALLLLLPAFARAAAVAHDQELAKNVTPLLKQFCYECHGDGASAGELELDALKSTAEFRAKKETIQKIIRYVRGHTMPPPEADALPTQAQRDALAKALSRQLYDFDPDKPDPGRVTIRRLNRAEYRNVVRDLLGVNFDPTHEFPQDDTGYGFDNIADVLTLPPMLMEKYLAAAETILSQAIPAQQAQRRERRIAASEARANFDRAGRSRDGWIELTSTAEETLSVLHETPAPAEYQFRVLAYATHPKESQNLPAMKLSLMLNDAVVREVEVKASASEPQWYEARVGLPAGRNILRASVRRERGVLADRVISGGRVGVEQRGAVYVKEFIIDGPLQGLTRRVEAGGMEFTGSARRQERHASLNRDDDQALVAFNAASSGEYLLRMQASADYAGNEPARVELSLDGKTLQTFEIDAPTPRKPSPEEKDLSADARRAVPRVYEAKATLSAGKHRLALRFVNNARDPEHPHANYRDRNVHVQHVEIVELSAPPGAAPLPEPLAGLFATYPKPEQARELIGEFAFRAWRRPVGDDEVDRLLTLYELARQSEEDHHASIRHAFKGVLVSLNFLFHGELHPPPDTSNEPYPVSEFELASRLSFFLWSSMPDGALLDLAQRGKLREQLAPQVKRMLASPKAQALVDNFAGQWLQFRNLDAVHPDEKMFEKRYDERLRDAMQRETQLFFQSIVREDRSLLDVLSGDYTFVNERLAKHYGIDGVSGNDFKRVSLASTPRRGVLTHGSVLTLTSNPTRTSPVKRGKWVLENLLGVAPPPPPPDVPPLVAEGKKIEGTMREQLERHRADPTCASCHAPMDPIGLGLENFDAIGAWREKDGAEPVDSSAAFADGTKFNGAAELTKLLAETRRNDFYRAATEAALTFALGRGVEAYDEPAVDQIVDELHKNNGRMSTLIMGVIQSVPFQMRRAELTEK